VAYGRRVTLGARGLFPGRIGTSTGTGWGRPPTFGRRPPGMSVPTSASKRLDLAVSCPEMPTLPTFLGLRSGSGNRLEDEIDPGKRRHTSATGSNLLTSNTFHVPTLMPTWGRRRRHRPVQSGSDSYNVSRGKSWHPIRCVFCDRAATLGPPDSSVEVHRTTRLHLEKLCLQSFG
jgi:hypothetical protein